MTCSATDAADNTGSATFTVTINPTGSTTIGPGQTVTFSQGTVGGNVDVNGGTLILTNGTQVSGNLKMQSGTLSVSNSTIGGNLQIKDGGTFAIGPGTVITGNLQIEKLPASGTVNTMCGGLVQGNLQFKDNLAAVVIGSPSTGCAGNVITGNLQIDSNVAPVKVFGNQIHQNLQCGGNAAITGGGNTAKKKQGQCSAF